jgi:hypothetical protein
MKELHDLNQAKAPKRFSEDERTNPCPANIKNL